MYGFRVVSVLAVCLSAILPAVAAQNCASACARPGYRTSPDTTPLGVLAASSADECANVCLNLKSCQSFSYDTRKQRCSLSKKRLIAQQGWTARARSQELSGRRSCLDAQCLQKAKTVTVTQTMPASTMTSTVTVNGVNKPSTTTVTETPQPSTLTITDSSPASTATITQLSPPSTVTQVSPPLTVTETPQPSTVTVTEASSPSTTTVTEVPQPLTTTITDIPQASTITVTEIPQASTVTTTEASQPTTITITSLGQPSTITLDSTTTTTVTVTQGQSSTSASSTTSSTPSDASSTSASSTTASSTTASSTTASSTTASSTTASSTTASSTTASSTTTSSSTSTTASSTPTICNSPPTSVNAIQNPSFENGLSPWITVGSAGLTVLDTTDQAYDGSTSISMSTKNGANQYYSITFNYATLQQTVYTVPGTPYTFSYNYKVLKTVTDIFGCGFDVNFNGKYGGGSYYNTTSSQWLRNSFTYTPTSNTTAIQIVPTCGFLIKSGEQQVLLDNFALQGTVNCAAASCGFSQSNVVANPGFDNAGGSGSPWSLGPETSIRQGGNNGSPYAAALTSSWNSDSHSQSTTTISQTLSGLTPGSVYNVGYWYNVPGFLIYGSGGQCDLTSFIDSQQIQNTAYVGNSQAISSGSNGWQLTQGSFTATQAIQVLQFKWNCPQSGATVTALLDDVSVLSNALVCTATMS